MVHKVNLVVELMDSLAVELKDSLAVELTDNLVEDNTAVVHRDSLVLQLAPLSILSELQA